jgi:putative nucleotidyltransferase with HDIG domain
MDVNSVVLFKIDRINQKLYSKFSVLPVDFELSLNEGVTGWVARTGKSAVVNKPCEDHRYYPHFDRIHNLKTKNLLATPINDSRGKAIGVLVFANKINSGFDEEDLELAESLSAQMSVAFENAMLFENLMHTFRSLVEVLAITIDERHPGSKGHSLRVAIISEMIADEMGLDSTKIELIKLAAYLHDYGKISIPDSILKKEGYLTDEEFEIMKDHAISTYNILKRVYFSDEMSNIPKIAALHHERWDGKGYPFGMKGEEIPLGARIIAVADVFDAMTSWREYHNPYSKEIAIDEIKRGKNDKFDPKVVDAFMNLVESGKLDDIKTPEVEADIYGVDSEEKNVKSQT